jgi:carboxymethylenebutenolidase
MEQQRTILQTLVVILMLGALACVILYFGPFQTWKDRMPANQKTDEEALQAAEPHYVKYFGDVEGYYAAPTDGGEYPGVVMVHEWWGLNDAMKDAAKSLAAEGYRVLAVDLYKGKVASTSEDARAYVAQVDAKEALANLQAAAAYLHGMGSAKVASLGWCFGGGKALELALSGTPLDATVIYYGQPVRDVAKLKAITWPVLGIFGEKDASIPVDSVRAFDESLTSAGVVHEIHIYPGVGHAFANPSNPDYAPAETADAWIKTLAFLRESLKK